MCERCIKHISSCFDDNSYNFEPCQSQKAISLKHFGISRDHRLIFNDLTYIMFWKASQKIKLT